MNVVIERKKPSGGSKDVVMESKKQTILNLFEASGTQFWKTLREIAAETHIHLDDVVDIVTSSRDFVESATQRRHGDLVFTARRVYEKRTPLWRLFLSMLAEKID